MINLTSAWGVVALLSVFCFCYGIYMQGDRDVSYVDGRDAGGRILLYGAIFLGIWSGMLHWIQWTSR